MYRVSISVTLFALLGLAVMRIIRGLDRHVLQVIESEKSQEHELGTKLNGRHLNTSQSECNHLPAATTGEKVRILYSHRIHSRDGQSVHVEELVGAFRAAGNKVLVIGPRLYENARFGGESPTVATIRKFLPTVLKEVAEILLNVINYYRLYRAYRDFAPDLIYERYNLYLFAGSWLGRWTGLPFYLEVNSPLAAERSRFGDLRLKAFAHVAERFVWRSADRVLAVTTTLKDIIAASGVGRERIHVVSNGVVLERFRIPTCRPVRDNITLGFVGFLRDWHGLDSVIEAMSKYSGVIPLRLVVVGDGPARPALESQAASLGILDNVDFMGVVPFEEVPGLLCTFDIALQPKAVPYASPLKIFDYMAAGLAIVAPDQANIREILLHRVNAILFDPANDTAMWRAINELIASPELINQLGLAARAELVSKNYTWRGNAERIGVWAAQDKQSRQVGAPTGRR
ncbi:MAG: glycosyltransferase family 4 protein [Rhodopila sp.]